LYDRIAVLGDHWAGVGKNLNEAVSAYNKSVASLESRVLVTARRFRELKVASEDKDIRMLTPVETHTRGLQASELLPATSEHGAT